MVSSRIDCFRKILRLYLEVLAGYEGLATPIEHWDRDLLYPKDLLEGLVTLIVHREGLATPIVHRDRALVVSRGGFLLMIIPICHTL